MLVCKTTGNIQLSSCLSAREKTTLILSHIHLQHWRQPSVLVMLVCNSEDNNQSFSYSSATVKTTVPPPHACLQQWRQQPILLMLICNVKDNMDSLSRSPATIKTTISLSHARRQHWRQQSLLMFICNSQDNNQFFRNDQSFLCSSATEKDRNQSSCLCATLKTTITPPMKTTITPAHAHLQEWRQQLEEKSLTDTVCCVCCMCW